jgi:hypothetical protein
MIPPEVPPDTPGGESLLFRLLRDDPDTGGWVVLHSLEIRRHRTKAEGEIDMVILAPGLGVLCIEVKGCDVKRRDGRWIYPYGESLEGPFRQASRSMHSLRDYIQRRDASLSGVLFWSAVAFTRMSFDEESPEWHSWQVIDDRALGRAPVSKVLSQVFERAHFHISNGPNGRGWYDNARSRPTAEKVRRLTSLLRGDFERVVQPRSDIQRIEQSLLKLTEDQYDALDAVEENPRMVIKGLAGTGKTLLAIEAARRAVSAGKRVLLVCYNRLLGDWLKSLVPHINNGAPGLLRCVHLHGLLLELAGDTVQVSNENDFWRRELPELALERLVAGNSYPQFDFLIVDEAQDILVEEYLDVFELLLSGALADGHWTIFGDFERQSIYLAGGAAEAATMLLKLKFRAPNHATFTLRVNCRNAGPIAETLTLACNVYPGYSRFLREMEGAGVDPRFWADMADQQTKLENAVSLLRQDFSPADIVVLSLCADDKSCATQCNEKRHGRYVSMREAAPDRIRFSTIHAFKGLEAPAIIVTDVQHLDQHAQAMLYVAISRARVRLILLMHSSCRRKYDEMLEAGLRTGRGGRNAA